MARKLRGLFYCACGRRVFRGPRRTMGGGPRAAACGGGSGPASGAGPRPARLYRAVLTAVGRAESSRCCLQSRFTSARNTSAKREIPAFPPRTPSLAAALGWSSSFLRCSSARTPRVTRFLGRRSGGASGELRTAVGKRKGALFVSAFPVTRDGCGSSVLASEQCVVTRPFPEIRHPERHRGEETLYPELVREGAMTQIAYVCLILGPNCLSLL